MLKDIIKSDMIKYMKEKNKEAVTTIRMVNGAIKNKEIELKSELTDDEVISVLNREIKQYKESLEFATQKERQDEIDAITYSIQLLSGYLPEQLTDEEANAIVVKLLTDNNITEKKQKGLAMKLVMPELKGKYDGSKINKLVDSMLK